MPRAAPNVVLEVYAGNSSATPNAFKRLLVARLVPQPLIELQANQVIQFRTHWATYDGPFLLAAPATNVGAFRRYNIDTADYVIIQGTTGPKLRVIWNETVTPRFGVAQYKRTHLGP